jgi:hypothetical protein
MIIVLLKGRPVRQTYRRANTSINLGGVVDNSSDLFRSCSNILDKFGSKPTRDNLAVVNGSVRSPNGSSSSSASLKEFLLGRSKEPAPYPPDLPLKVSDNTASPRMKRPLKKFSSWSHSVAKIFTQNMKLFLHVLLSH